MVYFSTKSGYTEKFVSKLGFRQLNIPLKDSTPIIDESFVLVTPTYGGGDDSKAVPKPVIRFLNIESNRELLRGVVSTGNRNFGSSFGAAGKIISKKCKVPHLTSVELFGTREDVEETKTAINQLGV